MPVGNPMKGVSSIKLEEPAWNGLSKKDINVCKRLAAFTPNRIKLTPHMLRHTFLKRVTDEHGIHVAQKLSGNVSVKEIFRYAKPSEDEAISVVEGLF